MSKILYPDNFDEILSNYHEKEYLRIRERYKHLYIKDIQKIEELVEDRFNLDCYNIENHCRALSCALNPFINKPKFKNYELLFVEPLLYLKNKKKIPDDVGIWDFTLGEISENQLRRIILREVKAQKAQGNMDKMEKLLADYLKSDILEKLYNYIEELNIRINREHIKIEKILVVPTRYFKGYKDSIINRRLNVNVWEIKPDLDQIEYSIEVHREGEFSGVKREFTKEDRDYSGMLNNLNLRSYKFSNFIQFTYASDVDVYLNLLYKSYPKLEPYSDKNIIRLIQEAGGGNFYDDKEIINEMITRIKKVFIGYEMLKVENGQTYFKKNIHVNEKIKKKRFKKEIDGKSGSLLLEKTIRDLNPQKSIKGQFSKIDRWID